ncbi:tetratricopeptide repeat-containing sensor histidine kinase [Algibacter pacificus]|uniref:tetratricopeptide repeat-containing sensor histidine kinase n=1 Tax=Algibacter pacificus TaxID=2599389 RepID=UPI0011C85A03|nr:ATP-binding protein [Algibacter pacificus]
MSCRRIINKLDPVKISNLALWVIIISCLNSFSLQAQKSIKKDLQLKIKTLQKTHNFKKDTVYINLLYDLGMQYSQYNLDSLRIVSNESLNLSDKANYIKGQIQGNLLKGLYFSNKGEQDQAILYFSKAISDAAATNEINLFLESKIKLAVEYKFKDDYAKALKQYLDAIQIAKTFNKYNFLSRCYVNISVIYSIQKEYHQAIFYLMKAMELNKKDENDIMAAKTMTNITDCYIKIGDLKNASSMVNRAIAIFKPAKLDSWLAYAFELKGTIYLKQENFNLALIWLKKSENIHKQIDKNRYKIPLFTRLSKTYFGLKEIDFAENYAKKALQLSKTLKIIDGRDAILELLYKLEKERRQPEKAITYLEELKTILDTINKKNNRKELRRLKSNLDFEQEKEQYILENEQQQIKQLSYIYIALLIILAFLVIIIILKRNNKEQNILNQKLTENTRELQQNEAHLNDVNTTKNKLFSIIAHDLKGPINSFKELFDLFNKSELTTEEFIEFMPQIGENIDSIAFTLNNLLTWGQTQMNGLVTEPSLTNIKTLVDENIALLSKQRESKSIQITNTLNLDVVSWCDKNQIDIVIRNLISNALKFTHKQGAIHIHASEQSNLWKIEVKDNGIGISKTALTTIFKEKDTSTSYGTMNEKGTGLGLRVCKEMVKNNGGHIWVESEINIGTSFYFTIPKTKAT